MEVKTMEEITLVKKLTPKREYDIIVCGGGVAGAAAAVTAAKAGKSVLLIEKTNILGGLGTLGIINYFVPMCNGRGKQIIFGLCEKWVRLSAKYGYDSIPEEWKNGEPKEPTLVRYTQRFSPDIFALQLTEEVTNSGADLLFDCLACEPVMEGNTCKGVITESKSGTEYYSCKMLIDVTGDCDVLRHGGVPVVEGTNVFHYIGGMITLESCKEAVEKENIRFAYKSIVGGHIKLKDVNKYPEFQWSGLTVDEVTDYLKKGQHLMLENLKKTDRNSRDITHLPFMPQFRTTCHLDADYTLQLSDCYKHFDDSICAINAPDHRDLLFEVPLRCLTRKDYPNMLTAGRTASAKDFGWEVLRVIPAAIVTGQAAALAASIAIDDNVRVTEVDIKKLQDRIEKENIMVHFPDEYLPENKAETLAISGVGGEHI